MGLRVYIAYGTRSDQVHALRLQALAAVNGLTVYVPAAHTRDTDPSETFPSLARQLTGADVILGVINSGISDACRQELTQGRALGKHLIVLASPTFAPQLETQFPGSVVVVEESNPGRTESQLVEQLRKENFACETRQGILALTTVALGLLLFAAQD